MQAVCATADRYIGVPSTMPTNLKITVDQIYDRTPSLGHRAGDIWSGLPMHGMLGLRHVTGIVITPDCDLTNRKTETITYLPVLPLKGYFSTPAIIPSVVRVLRGQLEAARLDAPLDPSPPYHCPPRTVLNAIAKLIRVRLGAATIAAKDKIALERADAAQRILARIGEGADSDLANHGECAKAFGEKEWRNLIQAIVRNSHSTDLHFLPPDQSQGEWSAVRESALVLFRYPLCIPVQALDAANDISVTDWRDALTQLRIAGALLLEAERPLKRAQLRPRFFADLLTRYVGMHVRLGSPDFTPETIDEYVDSLVGH